MSKIADAIRQEMAERKPQCRTCIFIASRPGDEAFEWVEALKDKSLTSAAAAKVISKALADTVPDGPRALSFTKIGEQAVTAHRNAGHQ